MTNLIKDSQSLVRPDSYLTIISVPFKVDGRWNVVAKCKCGNIKNYILKSLKKNTKSCGCYKVELAKTLNKTHGKSREDIYHVWLGMKARCYYIGCESYLNYGLRGITVCEEWINDFIIFYNWANQSGYKKGLQLDRINSNGNYTPLNCRFVTSKENNRNRRCTRFLTIGNETKPLGEWAEMNGIKTNTLDTRIKNGWSNKKLFTPIKMYTKQITDETTAITTALAADTPAQTQTES